MGWFGRWFGKREAADESPPDPRQAFVELVATEAAQHPLVTRVEPDMAQEFTLRLSNASGEATWTLHLNNLYLETRECSPQERLERVRSVLRGLDDGASKMTWEEARASLVPLVRLCSFGASAPVNLLSRPFLPFVPLFVGIDREETIMMAHENHLQDWQRDRSQIVDLAIENLQAHVQGDQIESYDPTAPYPIWFVARNDSYESSRLALPGYLASFRERVAGNPIAIIPHRSALIISGDAHEEAIARLAKTAEAEFGASPRPLSPVVYTLDADDAVAPLSVAPEHALSELLGRGPRILAATCYADQKELLDADFGRTGTDVFVATLGCLEKEEGGRLTTWATMAQDVETLLPKADCIALVWEQDGETKHMMVDWDVVSSVAPECLVFENEFDPPRFRVRGWPGDAALKTLRHNSISSADHARRS